MAVVAALGTRRGVDLLFDRSGESPLILAAKKLDPPPLFAVFSWTACEKKNVASRCRQAGADGVICSAEGLIDLLVPPAPRFLCLAGEETTATVQSVAGSFNYTVVRVSTVQEALDQISNKGPWGAVVAALGTNPSDLIFDGAADRSTLISTVKKLQPSPTMVVFSHTACRYSGMAQACTDAGADAVMCTPEALKKLILSIQASRASFLRDTSSSDMYPPEPGAAEIEADDTPAGQLAIYKTTAEYPVVAVRIEQNRALERSLGSSHRALKDLNEFVDEMIAMIESLPRSLTVSSLCAPPPIRFVHISDTHHHHKNVYLPEGEVLLHTGDLVGNYGDRDIQKHLSDFLDWLVKMSSRFQLIAIIAGNHDTLLDEERYPREAAKVKRAFLSKLPGNVRYLENDGVEYQGLKIWGSPIVCCREETLGKRYLSNAFERRRAERQQIWSQIPEGLDVLMTHVPPHRILCSSDCGCELLLNRLKQLSQPPRFHCFGHDHDYYGVKGGSLGGSEPTIFINGALEEVRRMDRGAEGCGWVFDILRRDVLMRTPSMASND
eukprot:Skav224650  [mRNA]  locus=scaffold4300:95354:97009:+ [translate_table: standard]